MNQTPTPIPPDNLFAMAAATAHADREHEGWSERAMEFLIEYARANTAFIAEQVLAAAEGVVPAAPTDRAWGTVFCTASRRGLIRKTGKYGVRFNGCPAVEWERGGQGA